jgi:prolyl-tRNA synthetase
MTHGDDKGLVCPPLLAQYQVVVVPIYKTDAERESVLAAAEGVRTALRGVGVRVHVDARDGLKPGAKYYEWEARGVPFRLEIGPRDVAAGTAMLARRTGGAKESVPMAELAQRIPQAIAEMQRALLAVAVERREANSLRGATRAQLLERMGGEGGGGFVYGGWCGGEKCEAEIKAETKATIRCLPDPEFRSPEAPKTCVWCGAPAQHEALWAKAY